MKDSKAHRWIDRWVGQLLCWAIKPFPRAPEPAPLPPRPKILLIEIFEMGAAVMLIPTLRYLRRVAPDAEICCLTSKTTVPIWRATGELRESDLVTLDTASLWSLARSGLAALRALRRRRFDLVLDCELFMRLPAIFAGLVGAPRVAGFHRYDHEGLGRGRIHDIPCAYNQNQHIARNLLALAKTAVEGRADRPNYKGAIPREEIELPPYEPSQAARDRATAKLHARCPRAAQSRLIVVSHTVGPILAVRDYPFFAAALRQILAECPDAVVCLVGTSKDAPKARAICAALDSSRSVELCGETDFDELLALLASADLVIANDNGVAHFGAWARVPTIALFSTDSPFMYGPLGTCKILYSFFACSPCISAFNHKTSPCDDNRCLKAIAPETVATHALAALGGQLEARTVNGAMPYLP